MKVRKSIKAVIMDGDGSTITQNNELPKSLRDLMLKNRHVKWIMATGRSLDLLHKTPIAQYLSDDVPHIVDGGGRLMYLDGRSWESYFISNDDLRKFHSLINPDAVQFIYYSSDGIKGFCYSMEDNTLNDAKFNGGNVKFTKNLKEFETWTFNFPPTKIFVNAKHELKLDGLYYNVNENNIDVTAQNINKGSACLKLLEKLNLKHDEVIFVFNDKNDLPIVEHHSLSQLIKIKVGGALPNTICHYSVSSPYDVAQVVQQLIDVM